MPKTSLKQRADGRYTAKYKGIFFYGKTQKEAIAKRDEYKRQEAAGIRIAEAGTLTGAYCLRWFDTYKAGLTTAAKDAYLRHIRRFCSHQIDGTEIGYIPIRNITASDIQSFLNTLQGLSYSSVAQYTATIRAVFKAALSDRIILFDPTSTIKPPKAQRGTHRALEEWERVLIHSTPHRARLAALTMLYAGLRRGEALALDIDRDIDFDHRVIHVRYAVRFKGQHLPELVDPKTEAGTRDIPIPSVLLEELRDHHGLLLPSASGELMTESAWKRCWQSYMTALSEAHNGGGKRWHKGKWEQVDIRAHDLRHTYCTILYDSGVDVKTAQAWMGHADAQVTMQIYTHLSASRERAAVEALERFTKAGAGSQNGSRSEPAKE